MHPFVFTRLWRRCAAIAAGGAIVVALATSTAAQTQPRVVSSQPAPARTHQLFVGVDLYVPTDSQMMQVRNIVGGTTLAVSDQGAPARLDRTNGFRWKLVPKVSNQGATISDFSFESTYSPGHDPQLAWMGRQVSLMGYQQDQMSQADRLRAGPLVAPTPTSVPSGQGGATGPSPEQIQSDLNQQLQGMTTEMDQLSDMTDPSFGAQEIRNREDATQPDAVRLEFRASAPTRLANAYCVALVRLRQPDGNIEDTNFYQPIGELGPKPRKISLLQTGLPPGAELLDVKLHLFNSGKELATNLSQKRFDLTAAEARQYLLLDHTANHRGQTLPAQPVWELAPAALKAADRPGPFDQPVQVNIDPDGQLTGFAVDSQIVTPEQREIIAQLVFLPALQDGQPVASTLTLNLADYFR